MSGQARRPVERDPLVAALARYVEALHRRYPEGPGQVGREPLAGAPKGAKIVAMDANLEDRAA
jgi:hypothetical protein